jgi:hypothetical protein
MGLEMKFIIIDWMYNVCFYSDTKTLKTFDQAVNELDYSLMSIHGEECNLEEEAQEYSIEEYREGIDRLMWNGQRYVFKPDYYKVSA